MRFLCEGHQNCPRVCGVLKQSSGSRRGDFTEKEMGVKKKRVLVKGGDFFFHAGLRFGGPQSTDESRSKIMDFML